MVKWIPKAVRFRSLEASLFRGNIYKVTTDDLNNVCRTIT